MKKLSIFACLSFFALTSFTTKSGDQGTPIKAEAVVAEEAIAGQITIVSIDPDGFSGIAMTSSGVAVAFVNPFHLPVGPGVTASASITFDCPIIDPPKRGKFGSSSTTEPTTSSVGSTQTYGVAVIISL